MGGRSLTWEDCLPVVEAESRRYERAGAQIGLERDDLRQEASIAALQCLASWQAERGGRSAYVRQAVRNRFADVRRKALREMRVPHDAHGRPRPQWLASYEALIEDNGWLPHTTFDHTRLETRSVLEVVHARLPPDDWEFLVRALVQGAHLARDLALGDRRRLEARLARVRKAARRIVNQVLELPTDEVLAMPAPVPALEELPECHPKGTEPQGYDREDGVCWNCRDKFTCLPEALERSLIGGTLSDDREVEAVLSKDMTFRTAIERMRTRLSIMERGGTVPDELQVHALVQTKADKKPSVVPPPELETERPIRVAQEQAEETVTAIRAKATKRKPKPKPATKAAKKTPKKAPKRTAKKAPKKAAKKPKAVKKPAPKPAPKPARRQHVALVDTEGRPTMRSGKPLPPIRANTVDQMAKAMARVRIGQPFDLAVGMQLVRKVKEGDHVIVTVKPLGFELDNVLYSSLSTAIMYRLRKMQSGNAYFHLEQNQCTEIWSKSGEVLAGHSTQ